MPSKAPKAPVGVDAVSEEDLPEDALIVNSKNSFCEQWLKEARDDYIELQVQLDSLGQSGPNHSEGKRKRRQFVKVSSQTCASLYS